MPIAPGGAGISPAGGDSDTSRTLNIEIRTMKKLIAVLMATATMWLSAAEVVELRNFNDGEVNAPRGGKLTRVEVFSTNATGSVTLKSVWAAPVFTNAVLIESVTATNVTVVSSNRTAALWRSIPVTVIGDIVVYTNKAFGTIHTVTNTATVYTNIPNQVMFTNAYPAAGFTFGAWQRAHPVEALLSSNTVVATTATTNVWPVFQREASITNTIISGGSLSGNKYGGAPGSDTWIAPGERLIYEGPKGGFLRLILE